MTVCAAAICTLSVTAGGPVRAIIAVSDRMHTVAGNTEYEPANTTKIVGFSPARVIALGAGDSSIGYAIATQTHRQIIAGDVSSTDVGDIAKGYADNFWSHRQEYLARKHLWPIGLTTENFAQAQRALLPDIAREITDALRGEDLEAEALICGLDEGGPHIYHVDCFGDRRVLDREAFCAIGSGSAQFEAAFMAAGYDSTWAVSDALLLLYSAKKQAEAAVGVGEATDVFFIAQQAAPAGTPMIQTRTSGPGAGDRTFNLLSREAMLALDEHYQGLERKLVREREKAAKKALADGKLFFRSVQ